MPYEDVKHWRKTTKAILIDCLGGKCNRCGYNRSNSSMDFHHIDPATKEHNLSTLLAHPCNRKRIIEEARKCILLCKNCHGEFHDGIWLLSEIDVVAFDTAKLHWSILKEDRQCLVCGKSFPPRHEKHYYCGHRCSVLKNRRCRRPSKTQLKKMLWKTPTTKIAALYGVSDKAVTKWAKSYNLDKPPRGYWSNTVRSSNGKASL